MSVSGFAYDENNNVYIGFETGSYKYEEPHMEYPISFKGHKVGASFEWVGRRILEVTGLKDSGDNSFATFEARYMTGDVKYKGYLQEIEMIGGAIHTNYTPIQMNDVPDYYIEGRVTLGQTYNFKDVCEIWPYIGFGYRRLSNKTEKVDAENGYKRVSQYWYIPIGFRLVKGSDGGFKISFISEFDWLIHGEQASQIGNVVEQMFPEVETNYVYNYQRRGWGARFSVKLEAPVTKHAGIFVEPYFRMWKIQNSSWGEGDVHTYEGYYEYWYNIPFKEPFNVTKELGIRAGIYF
ncbi:MAG: hypothetical protein J6S61_01355 [Elusimicrobiaceae bacterium]|nr:hypothetical protein [Elusimicrobiaceae bacterium]